MRSSLRPILTRPGQIVISGHRTAVERAAGRAKEAGCAGRYHPQGQRPLTLPVDEGAAEKLKSELAPDIVCRAGDTGRLNVTAAPYPGAGAIADLLVKQLVAAGALGTERALHDRQRGHGFHRGGAGHGAVGPDQTDRRYGGTALGRRHGLDSGRRKKNINSLAKSRNLCFR